jgi:hypothetical protein
VTGHLRHFGRPLTDLLQWGGSVYFSENVGSAANRTKFVNTVIDFIGKYGLDGIDFEYVLCCVGLRS